LNVDGSVAPLTFALRPLYPNPFVISDQPLLVNFSLSRNESARLSVFNVLGQEVATLLVNRLLAGNHTQPWDGRQANGELAPSGIYFIRLQTETAQATRRVVVLR
jgi:flagellar hook assembly protein FlgD